MKPKMLPIKLIPPLSIILLLAGCAGNQVGFGTSSSATQYQLENKRWIKQALYAQFDEWQAVPHQTGGLSKRGIDCSGFVYLTYLSKLGIKLPRSSDAQMHVGRAIATEELTVGDLVFFKTGENTRHVGIYLDDRQFLHVSTSKGVTISRLDDRYWSGRYWKALRVIG
jgi:cell wall-associated NlpC family hydrolase